jgi:hypothetical protein
MVPVALGRTWPSRKMAVVSLGAAVIVAVAFAVQGRGTTDSSAPVPQAQSLSPGNDSPAASVTTPAVIGQRQPAVTPERPVEATPAPVERPDVPETSVKPASVIVLNARLCSALEREGSPDWQCAQTNGDLPPGRYIFYTRLQTNTDTTVEHRWYRGERVQQVRRLPVAASPGRGYRTFSSNTVSAERAGDWRVELRGADGTVLWEERFVIRFP